MADFGSANGRTIVPAFTRVSPGTFSGTTFTDYNINDSIGTISGRTLGGGGGGGTTLVYEELYVDVPPAPEGAGDWPIRLHELELEPSTTVSGNEIIPDLYVGPENTRTYIRYWEIVNYSGGSRTVSINMAGYPEVRNISIANGAKITSPEGFNFPIGAGEVVEGKIDSDVDGVWCLITGILTVL